MNWRITRQQFSQISVEKIWMMMMMGMVLMRDQVGTKEFNNCNHQHGQNNKEQID